MAAKSGHPDYNGPDTHGRLKAVGRPRFNRRILVPLLILIFLLLLIRTLIIRLGGCSPFEQYTYSFVQGNDLVSRGNPILVEPRYIHQVKLPNTNFVRLGSETVSRYVFVTAASSDLFDRSLDCIASIQKYFPGYWLIFYDMGLTDSQKHKVQQMCSVIYRKFDFHMYPAHMEHLYTNTWRPAVLQEVLRDFGGAFWVSPSVRFKSNDIRQLHSKAVHSRGLVLPLATDYSIYAATDSGTYKYLPVPEKRLASTLMYSTDVILMYNTDNVYDSILSWWVLCSLHEDCIASSYSTRCSERFKGTAGCHKFDASILNMLAAQSYNYNTTQYHTSGINIVDIVDKTTYRHHVKYCGATSVS